MQFLIVGNGIAGVSAAYTIRRINHKAGITIISKEPHPAYSACVLPDYLSGELIRERVFIKKFQDYLHQNIKFMPGKEIIAIDVNQRKLILPKESIPYDKLIIATGGKSVVPQISGLEKKGVFRFKSLEDADIIHNWDGQAAAVIGSGPIGVEVGLALKRRGYRVFVVEFLDSLLPQVFDDYPALIIKGLLQRGGIEVSTHEKAGEILGAVSVKGVATDNRKITCDTVIIATGVRPAVGAVEGALKLGTLGGILTDDSMYTGVPDIYACGDCVETKSIITGHPVLSLLWHNARHQGEIAGSCAAGIPRTYPGSLNITSINLFGTQAVSIGLIGAHVEQGLEVVERKRERRYQRLILSDGVLVGAQSINWSENMGDLLSAIFRKEKQQRPEDLFTGRKTLFQRPRYFPFGPRSGKFNEG